MEEDNLQGKYFSITDPKGTSTVIYQVNRTEKEYLKTSPKYTVERLEFTEEIVGERKKKTFYVDNPAPDGNPLVILSFGKERVVINMGFLDYDVVKISIIDPETTEEVKPILYFDEETREVKGKCKLKPYKKYFAFEVRSDNKKK